MKYKQICTGTLKNTYLNYSCTINKNCINIPCLIKSSYCLIIDAEFVFIEPPYLKFIYQIDIDYNYSGGNSFCQIQNEGQIRLPDDAVEIKLLDIPEINDCYCHLSNLEFVENEFQGEFYATFNVNLCRKEELTLYYLV